MVPAVIFVSLLLAQAGRSVQQEQDCSNIQGCYVRLRTQMQIRIQELPGPDPTEANLARYKYFCETHFHSSTPCSRIDNFKQCSTQPGIDAREKVYEQVYGFVCAGNETSWRRFMGIIYAKMNDPCKGALEATRDVLKGQSDKCGTVKQLFEECATQQRLPVDQLEAGMELLGCQQKPPTTPATPPVPDTREKQRCNIDEAWKCLKEEAMDLATSFGFKQGDTVACPLRGRGCLEDHPVDGCSFDEGYKVRFIQAGITKVRTEACLAEGELLKKIQRVGSCYDLAIFNQCLSAINVHINEHRLQNEECRSTLDKTNDCIENSRKNCAQDADAWIVKKLPLIFLSDCRAPPAKPTDAGPKGNGVSLASSVTLAVSVALLSAFAPQH